METKSIDIRKVVWIGVVIAVIAVFVYERSKINNRVKNAVYTEGEILGIEESAKGSKYVKYSFSVNGKVFTGSVNTGFCDDCDDGCCESGRKVKVRYDLHDPDNSDLVKE